MKPAVATSSRNSLRELVHYSSISYSTRHDVRRVKRLIELDPPNGEAKWNLAVLRRLKGTVKVGNGMKGERAVSQLSA